MKKDMTTGREWTSILAFSLPIMGANILQVLYNFVDSLIVGNFVNATALGAIGLTSSMTWLAVTFCTSLGGGVNIAVSQYYGARKEKDIKETIAAAFLLALLLSAMLTAACAALRDPLIVDFLEAPVEMRADSRRYFLIYSAGIVFQMVYNVAYGILRAHGDSRGALIFLLISALVNVVLDCLFVIGFGMGVTGAAIATVIAQAGSAVASLIYMGRYYRELLPDWRYLAAWKEKMSLLIRLSVPIALQTAVTATGFIILQRLINSFGTPSIEGFTAMGKIEQFAHIPSQSFNVAIASFVGQNIGAGEVERAQKGYRSTVKMGVLISAVICVTVLLLDEQLLGLFGISGEAMRRGREQLDLLMLFIWTSTITNITCGFLQGAGDVRIPAMSGFLNLGIRLALSFALAPIADFRCFYVSMPPAWLSACLLVTLRYRSGKWKKYKIV